MNRRKTHAVYKRVTPLLEAIAADTQHHYRYYLNRFKLGKQILEASREEQRLYALAMVAWLNDHNKRRKQRLYWNDSRGWNVRDALLALLKRQLPFSHDDVVILLTWAGEQTNPYWSGASQMIKVIENFRKENPLSQEIKEKVEVLVERLESGYSTAEMRRWSAQLRDLVQLKYAHLPLAIGEAWSDAAIADIESMADESTKETWGNLFHVCRQTSAAKPTSKWLQKANPLFEKIGVDNFKHNVLKWFPLVEKPRTQPLTPRSQWEPDPNHLLHAGNADILKGLVWLCAGQSDGEIARTLMMLAKSAYRKVPTIGPRCVRVGNACVWALGEMPGQDGIHQLSILKSSVKNGSAQKGIQKALANAAGRIGMDPDEMEEMSVPDYGMQETGIRREQLGDFTAELLITGTNSTLLRWIRPDGKPQKSVPKAVQETAAEQVKALRQAAKDVRKMLPVQRDRLERFYLERKRWDYATWRERYLDHPLVGTLARKLIWKFSGEKMSTPGIWHQGQIISHDMQALDWLDNSTQVELWHPIHDPADVVMAWRNWLVWHGIQQPFKQAHREIYLLTDAEVVTNVYSNRFAAHILRQHQFNALCGIRGWKNRLRLLVDDSFPPATRLLSAWGLRAEFWIEGIGDNYGTDTNELGTYHYLTTDQVRFYVIDASVHSARDGVSGYQAARFGGSTPGDPLPLDQVPALAFTEIMRDVDLFVGVASVGNDPNWSDGGPEGHFRDYWVDYSYGALSETAKTRKQVLEQIIPRLKISERCELIDRFLVVQGDIRTYKIHLGSGNIMMEPNNQYLCIVPSRGAASTRMAGKVFLPFEGDTMLAVILSKAFLLAEDHKIADPTIRRQIKRVKLV